MALQRAVLMIAVMFGLLGNVHVIVSSLLKNNHYFLVLHLAVCDLFYVLFFTPTIYAKFTNRPLTSYSSVICKILSPTHTSFLIAGVHFMVLISITRYYAILHPLKPAVSRRALKIVSIFVYIFAIVCCIPILLVLKFDKNQNCEEDWSTESLNVVYTVFLASIQYFIPVLFLFIIYIKICKKLVAQNLFIYNMKLTKGRNKVSDVGRERSPATWFRAVKRLRNTKAFVVSFTIVICFMISGFPAQVTWIISVARSNSLPAYYLWFESLYIFGTGVMNPYVYGALDKKMFCQRKTISV